VLDFKKKVDILEKKDGDYLVSTCPVCKGYVCQSYFMQDSNHKKSKWFACHCGAVFQSQPPTGVYNKAYHDKHVQLDDKKKVEYEYPVRVYSPIIEELIYGRRVLLVGQTTPYQADAFAYRGWVPTIIDKNTMYQTSSDRIVADFEEHKFPESQKYNLIWIYHTLECFKNPLGSLDLCKTLLAEDGIIFIATPDTDFINIRSSSCFIHWKPEWNYLMWNKRSLSKYIESIGFNTILCRSNYEHRFPVYDDIHACYQHCFF
jgi:hypothetical protein